MHYDKKALDMFRHRAMPVLMRIACAAHVKKCRECAALLAELEDDDRLIRELRDSVRLYREAGAKPPERAVDAATR